MEKLTLQHGYKDALALILKRKAPEGIAQAIVELSHPISEVLSPDDVPAILCTHEFCYDYYRYLHYRFNVHKEILSAETIRLQLLFLAGEEAHYGQASDILKHSIMNNTKSLYPITKREGKKEYAQRTSRESRKPGNPDGITDTVLVALPERTPHSAEENLTHG
jgi:hypothetical protein